MNCPELTLFFSTDTLNYLMALLIRKLFNGAGKLLQMSAAPSQLLTECEADTQPSELPGRILSPANELVNVKRGGRDRCPP